MDVALMLHGWTRESVGRYHDSFIHDNDDWKAHVERETSCALAMDMAWLMMIYGIIFLSHMQQCRWCNLFWFLNATCHHSLSSICHVCCMDVAWMLHGCWASSLIDVQHIMSLNTHCINLCNAWCHTNCTFTISVDSLWIELMHWSLNCSIDGLSNQ